MPIIDAQVHAYERDKPERPWAAVLHGPSEVTGDDMVAAMDEVGVDGAILVSPFTMYRFDPSYALEVQRAHPGRFGLVKPLDSRREDIGEVITDWKSTPGACGVRIMMVGGVPDDVDDPGLNRVLASAGQNGLPVNLLCWGRISQVDGLARRNPNTRLVIDHLGLQQPFEPPAPPNPFGELEAVIGLASHDNVAVKVTGACTLAHEPYPYLDIWDPLTRLFDAYGFDRLMWGTDWTRAVELLTYEQGVRPFVETERLNDAERAALMGDTAAEIYNWSPS